MDLNYLFKRQQVETTLSQTAGSQAARAVHHRLASLYEKQIEVATSGVVRFQHEQEDSKRLARSDV